MKKKISRIMQMISILKAHNNLTIKEMAQMVHVSEMTIRRDIKELQNNKSIKVVNGVLIYNSQGDVVRNDDNYELSSESDIQSSEKERIGKFAASLIEPNDIIIIDSGTTTATMAENISDGLSVTVLCYTSNVLFKLIKKRGIDFIFAGGYYHPDTQMFESPSGIDLIRQVRANKVFFSAAGIHDKLGLTCVNNYEVATEQAIIQSSLTRILIADSSKFGIVRPAYFAKFSEVDIIVADNNLSDNWRSIIRDAGIELYLV